MSKGAYKVQTGNSWGMTAGNHNGSSNLAILVLDAENQGLLVETFKGALTLKITNAYPQFWEELQSRFGKISKLVLNTSQIGIINSTSSSLIASIGSVFLLGNR
jgi:ABC-type bacteriocin/lantibiotic exporter with double-glycine peptidase domain